MWQFPDKVQARQKYTDLVLKHQELTLKEHKFTPVENNHSNNFETIFKTQIEKISKYYFLQSGS